MGDRLRQANVTWIGQFRLCGSRARKWAGAENTHPVKVSARQRCFSLLGRWFQPIQPRLWWWCRVLSCRCVYFGVRYPKPPYGSSSLYSTHHAAIGPECRKRLSGGLVSVGFPTSSGCPWEGSQMSPKLSRLSTTPPRGDCCEPSSQVTLQSYKPRGKSAHPFHSS